MALQRQLKVIDGALSAPAPVAQLKVAFATADLKRVDQHFGSAERFAIYAVEPGHTTLLKVAEFGSLVQDGNENKLLEKFVVLEDCAAVYSLAVGASAVRQLVGLGIQPFKVPEGTLIPRLLDELQAELREGPSPWMARALARGEGKAPDRFDEMEDEGWAE